MQLGNATVTIRGSVETTPFTLNIFTCPVAMRANISILNGVPNYLPLPLFRCIHRRYHSKQPKIRSFACEWITLVFQRFSAGWYSPWAVFRPAVNWFIRGAWATLAKNPIKGFTSYVVAGLYILLVRYAD
jgi:hypothetical protein